MENSSKEFFTDFETFMANMLVLPIFMKTDNFYTTTSPHVCIFTNENLVTNQNIMSDVNHMTVEIIV